MIAVTNRHIPGHGCDVARLRRRARRLFGLLDMEAAQLSILLTGNEEIQQLNAQYRNLDKPTDVLSFPQDNFPGGNGGVRVLGDVVLSTETAMTQAARGPLLRIRNRLQRFGAEGEAAVDDWDLNSELLFLLLHGVLHLLGFDHEDDEEAETMESVESVLFPVLLGVDRRRNLKFNLESLVLEHSGNSLRGAGKGSE